MQNKLKKFFEFASYDSIVEEVVNIVETSLDGLNLLKIDDPNEPWGPCGLVEMDYKQKYLYKNNLNGVYAINLPNGYSATRGTGLVASNLINISIRFEKSFLSNEVDRSIEELEDRLKGEGYDWQRKPFSHGEIDLYRYTIYLGKWSHYKDEFGASINKFISENLTDHNYEMKGKENDLMDFFHDLSDEFGLVYFPIPVQMNDNNRYLEEQSSNGCWYLSRNTNQIKIKIAFKESYIKENIREFVYYIEELEDRLMDFKWESICDNRTFGAKHAYKVTHHIKKIVNNYRFTDEEIIDLEENKNIIPRIFHINCFVDVCETEEIEKSLFNRGEEKKFNKFRF